MVVTALPARIGPRPTVTSGIPHRQLDQQPERASVRALLTQRVLGDLPAGVHLAPSGISVPGARALVLDDDVPRGPDEAFLVGREFAHLHPAPDHSLHLTLPETTAREAVAAGWGEPHPLVATGEVPATTVMVYAPRTPDEVEIVCGLVQESHRFASAPTPPTPRSTAMTPDEMRS